MFAVVVGWVTRHLDATLGTHPEGMIADQRYGFIHSILKQNVVTYAHDPNRLQQSDKIDQVVTNRFTDPVIMVAILMGLYHFTFT